jgi:diadenosine tetraphosphatase ApaH/serine/threonine PP2A family protein phosphatase
MRTFAIGDVHGELTKLKALLGLCLDGVQGEAVRFIFLGDYIDRGSQSKGVVETLIDFTKTAPGEVICLLGNHEALALAALSGGLPETRWFAFGGMATIHSYRVSAARELPTEHLDWFRSLPSTFDDGRRLFVHAGVDPERSMTGQDEKALLWIREPFLSSTRDYGRLIVHGHTPIFSGKPELCANRLDIDTGAAYGGPLTAAVFDNDELAPTEFLQALEGASRRIPRDGLDRE